MPTPSKVHGNKDAAVGAVKENIGSAFGNHSLEAKGAAQRAEGNTEHKAAKTQGYVEGKKDSAKGSLKDTVGSTIGNQQMKAEGKGDKLKGDTKQSINA